MCFVFKPSNAHPDSRGQNRDFQHKSHNSLTHMSFDSSMAALGLRTNLRSSNFESWFYRSTFRSLNITTFRQGRKLLFLLIPKSNVLTVTVKMLTYIGKLKYCSVSNNKRPKNIELLFSIKILCPKSFVLSVSLG